MAGSTQAFPVTTLLAGGGAGMMEAFCCHPLDTIKVHMQLASTPQGAQAAKRGLVHATSELIQHSPLAFYRGFGPVITGIIPKMGIRFASFELYKSLLGRQSQEPLTDKQVFLAGIAAGVTEAMTVVNPMEVLKVRLQAQNRSKSDVQSALKYRNMAHAVYTIAKEEGVSALYSGIYLTVARQATNVSVNLTTYHKLKQLLHQYQPAYEGKELPNYQTLMIGLIAGSMGPISNAPIDTIKTRVQRAPARRGESGISHIKRITADTFREEGYRALYKGITPRIMRIGPGQAVSYTIYEFLKGKLGAEGT